MNSLLKDASTLTESYMKRMKFVCRIQADEKYVDYGLENNLKGIYVFYTIDENKKVVYLGETTSCLKNRIRSHKRSLRDPTWKTEVTGRKFDKYNVDRMQEFDVYFMQYEEEIAKYDSRTLEGLFKIVLNPIVFG